MGLWVSGQQVSHCRDDVTTTAQLSWCVLHTLAKSSCGLRGNWGASASHSLALTGVEQTKHRLNVTFGWNLHPPSSGPQLLGQRKETLPTVFLWEKVTGAAWPKWDTKVGRAVLGKVRQGLFQVQHSLRSTPRAVPLNHTWAQCFQKFPTGSPICRPRSPGCSVIPHRGLYWWNLISLRGPPHTPLLSTHLPNPWWWPSPSLSLSPAWQRPCMPSPRECDRVPP